jgi:GTP-binding protein
LEFLRHIERCAVLVHVLDCATLESQRDPLRDLVAIEEELEQYGGLQDRPRLVALNKVDIPEGRDLAEIVLPELHAAGYRTFLVSAVSHEGLRELGFALAQIVQDARAAAQVAAAARPRVVVRPKQLDDAGFTVVVEHTSDGPRYRVLGERTDRWIRQTDFSNDEAVGYLSDRLARAGIEVELAKVGAQPGSEVVIGDGQNAVVFDWQPTIADLHQGPRGTDERLHDNHRPGAAQRLAEHRRRQWGSGESDPAESAESSEDSAGG